MAKNKKEILLNELKKLIPQVDEKGLLFLIKQANTIIYNLQIDEMNTKRAHAGPKTTKKTKDTGRESAAGEESGVRVEDAPGGTSFFIILGTTRKVFSRIELRKIIELVKSINPETTPGERLYTWFKKHRGDVLFDSKIGSSGHPLLKRLAFCLRTQYTVKK